MNDRHDDELHDELTRNDHRTDAPETAALSLANYDKARELARKAWCPECHVDAQVIEGSLHRWVIDEHHEPRCSKSR